MKKSLLFLLISYLLINHIKAQGETDYWYFGKNTGLHFEINNVETILYGQLNSFEGNSTISDCEGNLLFYTNGITVFNKNHEIMKNGSNLLGHQSSTQSALIIHHPDKPYIYYIFTTYYFRDSVIFFYIPNVDNDTYNNIGLNYSIVDLRKDDGLGAIVEKNISILPISGEKLTATYHQNGNNIWIMAHSKFGNSFYCYKLNNFGLNITPVISNIGTEYIDAMYGFGYLKFSHKGDKIANVNSMMVGYLQNFPSSNIEIMKFNKNTGVLSDLIKNEISEPTHSRLYGVEFSYDDNKLYVSQTKNGIFQFDLSYHSNSWLNTSKVYMANFSYDIDELNYINRPAVALQLGKDKKIYISTVNFLPTPSPNPLPVLFYEIGEFPVGFNKTIHKLSTIGNPSLEHYNSNSTRGSIQLSSISREGLPNFNQSLFTTRIIAKDICLGNPTQFHIASLDTIETVHWDFGDGTSADGLTVSHTYPNIGSYDVIAQVTINGMITTVNKTTNIYLPPVANSAELIQCDDDTDGFSLFNLTEANTQIASQDNGEVFRYYETENDANMGSFETNIDNYINYQNEIAFTDTIYVRVENDRGCYDVSPLTLTVSTSQINGLMLDYYACDDLTSGSNTDGIGTFNFSAASTDIINGLPGTTTDYIISYYTAMDDALSEQNTIEDTTDFVNNASPFTANIFVRVESTNNNDCVGIGHFITLHITDGVPEIQMDDHYFLCENETITLEADSGYDTYLWSTGANTQSIDINHIGLYTITVGSISGSTICESTKEITVLPSNVAQIELVESSEWSPSDNSIIVHVNGIGAYEYSLDGYNYQDSNEFNGLEAQNYTIYVNDKNGCGVAVEDVYLLIYPKFFTPNNDGYNDTWQIFHYMSINFVKLDIYDRFGKLIKKMSPNGYGWDGKLDGKELPATDYWFTLEDENGKIYRGHFALKR